jgi:hypothetical protein
MKHYGLLVPPLLALLAAGLTLGQPRLPPQSPRANTPAHLPGVPDDSLASEAAHRWRTASPTHWRDCLLRP